MRRAASGLVALTLLGWAVMATALPRHKHPEPQADTGHITTQKDVEYGVTEGESLKLDLFLPGEQAAGQTRPGIVFIHGGGWSGGDKSEFDGKAREMARRGTSLKGATLLHLAVEFREWDIASWLLDHGADVNARSSISDGFGGHTPLYHAILSDSKDDEMARLLLDHGADPNVRADLRKQFRHMGDPERELMREYHDVTPLGYARRFQEPTMVSEPAAALIIQRGGME